MSMEIPVKKIVVPAGFIRSENEAWKNLDELAKSIREVGLIHPIKVVQKDDGYELIVGFRRLLAVRDLLKRPTIRAEVMEEPIDEIDKVRVGLIENIHRENLIDREKIDAAVTLLKRYKHYKDVADRLGISYDYARDLVGLQDAPEELVKMVGKGRGKLGRQKVIEILKAYPDDPTKAVEIAKIAASEGLTKDEKERLFEIIKDTPDRPVTEIKKEITIPRRKYEFSVVLPIRYYERFEKACKERDLEPMELAKNILLEWIDDNVPD